MKTNITQGFCLLGLCALIALPTCGGAQVLIQSVEPDTIKYGHATQISVKLDRVGIDALQPITASLQPGGPRIQKKWPLPHSTNALLFTQGRIYTALKNSGINFTDTLSDSLEQTTSFVSSGNYQQLKLHQNHLLAVEGGQQLTLFALNEGQRGLLIGTISSPSGIKDYAATGEQLYLLHSDNRIELFDISQPAAPRSLLDQRLTQPANHIAVDDEVIYLTGAESGITSYRLSANNQLVKLGRYRPDQAIDRIIIAEQRAYIALRGLGLTIVDWQDPAHPLWLGSHKNVGNIVAMSYENGSLLIQNEQNDLLLVDLDNPVEPSIICAFKYRATIDQIAFDGINGVISYADTVALVDLTPATPQYSNENLNLGQDVNFGGQRRAFITGDVLYVADWFSGIHLYDLSNPGQPRLLSSFHTPGSPKGVVVRDGYAFVADDDHGLQVIDITNPKQPVQVANLLTAGLAYTPLLVDDRLYLASHRGGFQIIDVSNPRSPQLLGEYDTPGKAWSIAIKEQIAYVADTTSGLLVFDVHDPANIQKIGEFNPGGNAEEVIIRGDIAYAAFFDQGFYVLDISDPAHPRQLGHISTPGNARGLDAAGHYVYLASWLGGVHVIDISDPTQPTIIGGYDTDGAAWGVKVSGEYAYALDWWGGLTTLDISHPNKITLSERYALRGRVEQIATAGNYAYVANGESGLQIFDINNPLNPTWVTGVELAEPAKRILLYNESAYLGGAPGKLYAIDIKNPFQPGAPTQISIPGTARQLYASKYHLYFADSVAGVLRLNSRGDGYQQVTTMQANDLWSDADNLYIAAQQGGLYALAIDAPSTNTTLHKPRMQLIPGSAHHHYSLLSGDTNGLITYSQESGIQRWMTNSPLPETILDADDRTIRDMQVVGDRLYAVDSANDIQQFNLDSEHGHRNPPLLTARYSLLSNITQITAHRDTLYLSGKQTITAMNPLPQISVSQQKTPQLKIKIPDTLPQGAYHLTLTTADGSNETLSNAIEVKRPRFSKPKMTMETFKKLLQQQLEKEQR
ncbi:MAG: hypothetical protein GXP10_10830 [Gammaproteobacteria bacterium]|nr:hypothetical protein [Gammaproteobacteria bacterium]